MGMTDYPHGIRSMGVPVLGGQGLLTGGNSYFVDPVNGSDSYDGKTAQTAKATLPAGEELLVANKNEVLYYLCSSSSISLSEKLTWDKNYTHLVGVCAPTMINQRARIFQLSTATGVSPLLDITASGCSFRNFYINQGVDDATSLVNVQVTGDRNYFENVHFAGIGNATMDAAGAASLKLDGAHENRFVNCSIGLDTIDAGSAANTELWFDSESSKNIFDDCLIYRRIEHTTNHPLVKVNDALGIGAFTIFRNCIFLYTSVNMAVKGDTIFFIPAISSKTRVIILKNCMAVAGTTAATDWDSNDRGILYADMVAPAALAAGGLATIQ